MCCSYPTNHTLNQDFGSYLRKSYCHPRRKLRRIRPRPAVPPPPPLLSRPKCAKNRRRICSEHPRIIISVIDSPILHQEDLFSALSLLFVSKLKILKAKAVLHYYSITLDSMFSFHPCNSMQYGRRIFYTRSSGVMLVVNCQRGLTGPTLIL